MYYSFIRYADERNALTHYLTQDGITERPSFQLVGLPDFLEFAMRNPKVGLLRGLRLILSVFARAQKAFARSMESVISIHIKELCEWASNCDNEFLFDSTCFSLSVTDRSRIGGAYLAGGPDK